MRQLEACPHLASEVLAGYIQQIMKTDISHSQQEVRVAEETRKPAVVHVLLQPEDKHLEIPKVKTARQLLAALSLREETALVARGDELLTPDRHIWPGDQILVRKVTSSG